MLAGFLIAWLLISALSVLWSFATPIAAAPDEPAHMVKAAAVVRGELLGTPGPDGTPVTVPQYIAYTHAQTCTAMNDSVTANCLPAVPGDPDRIVGSATTAGLYNPLYYVMVGWPTLLFDDSSGVYAMRVVSAVIASGFLALAAMLLLTWRRRALPLVAFGAAITPMVLFLNGSVNPNSVEIAATLAAFIAVTTVVMRAPERIPASAAAVAAVSGVVAANMRGLSPLWLAVALLAPFLLAGRPQILAIVRSWRVRISVIVIAAGVGFALAWLLISNSLGSHTDLPDDRPVVPYLGSSPITGFLLMLARTGSQLQEMIGRFGWMDTAAPVEVYAVWTLLIGGLVVGALVLTRGRRLLYAGALAAAFLLLPALAQAAFISGGGFIWQGRYSLPLLVVLLVGCGVALSERFDIAEARTRRILAVGVCTAWAAAQTYVFAATLHRYAVGVDGSWPDAFLAPQWAPPGGMLLLTIAFAATAALGSVLAYRLLHRRGGLGLPHPLAEDAVGKTA